MITARKKTKKKHKNKKKKQKKYVYKLNIRGVNICIYIYSIGDYLTISAEPQTNDYFSVIT